MIQVVLFLLLLAVIAWVQMHYLAPVNTKKEWAIFLVTMFIVAAVGSSLTLNIDLPSPLSGLRALAEPVGRTILH